MWDFFVCLGSQGEPLLKELGWFLRSFSQRKDLWKGKNLSKEEKEASPAGEKGTKGAREETAKTTEARIQASPKGRLGLKCNRKALKGSEQGNNLT